MYTTNPYYAELSHHDYAEWDPQVEDGEMDYEDDWEGFEEADDDEPEFSAQDLLFALDTWFSRKDCE